MTNPTLDLIDARCSTRTYADTPITAEEREAVLHAAFRAPTGGNMMLYSIIEVEDQALKERLAQTCDDQPFIARAPWVLLFVADFQKWIDLFEHCRVADLPGLEHRTMPAEGDLLLACSDALIAAQNAVIAAESLGIGSCYIGDILENAEEHQRLLDLPPHTLPVAMLCFGRPKSARKRVERQTRHMVMRDRYERRTPEQLDEIADDLARQYAPHGLAPGIANYPQAVYKRKFASAFMAEMNRSCRVWIDRWSGR